ncbi:MAG: hypothetical protein ORO03_05635, partial [Alphaproteobacteria bacterium]|nr:hypothetical protein [Alphaproteobacteria bacterium]
TLTQSGTAGGVGIVVVSASLQAGSDLSLIQNGTLVETNGSAFGLSFYAAENNNGTGAVRLAAGRSSLVTLKTNNNDLLFGGVDKFAVTSGAVRIDLGRAAMTSSRESTPPTGGYSLKARGLAVYYTGATSGNNATIDIGSGSFTFVNDKRSVTSAVTLNNSSTAAADWGSGLGTLSFANGTATSTGGLTLKTTGGLSSINNQGVVYGGAVTVSGVGNGVTAGAASDLRYIEGTTVIVATSASSFSGSLALVGSAIAVSTSLSTRNSGDLMLAQTGSAAMAGISLSGATLTVDRDLIVIQSGRAVGAGIAATQSTLTAKGVLSLSQSGTEGADGVIHDNSNLSLTGSQILLSANLTVTGNLGLTATRGSVWQDSAKAITARTLTGSGFDGFIMGGANKFTSLGAITNRGTAGVLVKNSQALSILAGTIAGGTGGVMIVTPGYDLTLGGAVTVTGTYLRLDLGSGKFLGGANSLTASGLAVYHTSAAANNTGSIAVGSGAFTRVIDNRSTTAATVLDNINSFTAPVTAGLTVTGTGNLTGIGAVYGGTVEIRGVTTGAAKDLRYIEGTGVGVTIPTVEPPLTALTAASG